MSTIIKNKIIAQAISLGFDFEQFDNDTDLQEVNERLWDFFNENSEKLERVEDECEVSSHSRSQYVSYRDYTSSGEIVDFSAHWYEAPETKVFHTDLVVEDDGVMKNMHLYYCVGETDYNAPEGFYYSKKEKKHILIPESELTQD